MLLQPKYTDALLPETESLKEVYAQVQKLIGEGKAGRFHPGLRLSGREPVQNVRRQPHRPGAGERGSRGAVPPAYGSFVLEVAEDVTVGRTIGHTTEAYALSLNGDALDLADLQEIWEARLEPVMPYRAKGEAVAPHRSHNEPEPPRHAPHRHCQTPGHHSRVPPAPTASTTPLRPLRRPVPRRRCWSSTT